jgi:predicted AlkP superfamily pyrophosphatase or phosphodiesterase
MKKSTIASLCTVLCVFLSVRVGTANASTKPQNPLVVLLVIDQFRADYLMRFQKDFLSPDKMGFRFLMEKGAYFPIADHALLNNMTCPGHAAILSGAYPYRHGISLNSWFDRKKNQNEYCVRDEGQKILGDSGWVADAKGISPKNFNANTLGDEFKNVDRPSQVVSVALKDRSAVMMGGKRADHVYWINDKACTWVTSQFYQKEKLPDWVLAENSRLKTEAKKKLTWGPYQDIEHCSKQGLQTPWAVEQTLKLALKAHKELKLGRGADTDFLLISLSSHDYLGHNLGPNSPHMKTMTLAEDQFIAEFLTKIAASLPNGKNDLIVALTADHGIPPTAESIPNEKMPNGNTDEENYVQAIEAILTEEYGKPSGGKWVERFLEAQVYLNSKALESAKVDSAKIAKTLWKNREAQGGVLGKTLDAIWSRDEIIVERKIPPEDLGKVVDRTLNHRNGDLVLLLKPFNFSGKDVVSHMTHYSYDRYVPLIIYGKSFKSGIYHQVPKVIDLAPTLAAVLGVLPPVQSEGKVLTDILK